MLTYKTYFKHYQKIYKAFLNLFIKVTNLLKMTNTQRCPECNSTNLTYEEERGELICNDCGLLVEEAMVDTGIDLSGKFDKSEKKRTWRSSNVYAKIRQRTYYERW